MESYIKRAWTNYSQPSALKSLHGFAKARGLKSNTLKETEKQLSTIYAFSVHKPARQKYPTRSIILKSPRENFCADLIDFQKFSRQNSGYNWVLVVLDGFTKELFVEPVRKKTATEVAQAFERIIRKAKKPPQYCFTDQGLEFVGGAFQELLKKYAIRHYVSRTRRKSFMCERVIRTIKALIFKFFTHEKSKRWLEIIENIVGAYNKTPHSSHGYKPGEIKPRHVDDVFNKLYGKLAQKRKPAPKFKIGDKVRIAKTRLTFQKGYQQSFSDTVFRIAASVPESVPVTSYKLETLDGKPVSSSFVDAELGYAT